MDGKQRRRRKSKRTRSNGRSEEKPKVSEVTSEKEEKDRLEAASVLSSLMFLPPKSAEQEQEDRDSDGSNPATSSSVTQFSQESGIPVRPSSSQGRESGGWVTETLTVEQLKSFIQNPGSKINQNQVFLLQNSNGSTRKCNLESVIQEIQNKQCKTATTSDNSLPATVTNPVGKTVNKTVASALRQAVSNNQKTSSSSPNSDSKTAAYPVDDTERHESIKKEPAELNLPLKKRRLIAMDRDNIEESSSTLGSKQLLGSSLSELYSSTGLPSLVSSSYERNSMKGSLVIFGNVL